MKVSFETLKDGLKAARAADTTNPGIEFRLKADWGQVYARLQDSPESEIMLPIGPALELPFGTWSEEECTYVHNIRTVEMFYEHLKRLVLAKAAQAKADNQAAAALPEPTRREIGPVGRARYILVFPRPISDEEFRAYGRMKGLLPFTALWGFGGGRQIHRSWWTNTPIRCSRPPYTRALRSLGVFF